MSERIICPSCNHEFEVSEALTTQLRQQLQKEFDAVRREREREFTKQIEQEVRKAREEARAKASEEVSVDLKELRERLSESQSKLVQAQQFELELRKQKQALEDEKREFDLTLSRRLDDEREKLRETVKKEFSEEHDLKDAQKEKMISDLRNQITELKRKSEIGSQQLQGEVLEEELERLLESCFPLDEIEPVPKGSHGGDVIQRVCDPGGAFCGTILWESKRTKSWSDGWLPKLRDDQRAAKADIAVIVSVELPKAISSFSFVDGVWVCGWNYAGGLAAALRNGIMEVSIAKRSVEGRQGKMDQLFNYLTGSEFRRRVEGIAEAFMSLRSELESEKRAMNRLWAKREKQLDRAMTSATGLHGDLSGILGAALPEVEGFALPLLEGGGSGASEEEDS